MDMRSAKNFGTPKMRHGAKAETKKMASSNKNRRTAVTKVPRSKARASSPTLAPPSLIRRDSYSSTAFSELIDRSTNATMARFTGGISPNALFEAYMDWATQLAGSPGKRIQLIEKAVRKSVRLALHMPDCLRSDCDCEPCIDPLPQDRRFEDDAWQHLPYNLMYQSFLLNQQWWYNATTGVRGVTPQHENVVEFVTRQILDVYSPSNFAFTNPVVLKRLQETSGQNLVQGFQNLIEDWERSIGSRKPEGSDAYEVGRDVALTPGQVVYRNRLIELIQYAPVTDKVHPEPILIIPAWIMKYYILDLSPNNSLIKYLTEQGYTVYMISWKNPGPEDRDLGMEDYRTLGVMEALDAVEAIVPNKKIHAVGYCLGGILASIAAATMARDHDERLKTVTLLASATDFTEPGELGLFINESQLSYLEDMMWEQGFLDTKQMSGAFQLLRSTDLIWSRMVNEYLMGERAKMNDLMAWNTDATRMPYRMHSEYLRRLYLNNDLAEGRYISGERPIALTDIRVPLFVVGTQKDHVAPWKSVYKVNLLTDTDVTFLLTSGGHNAGIVSEPGHPHRTYQVQTRNDDARYVDPDSWAREAPEQNGSWWPEWSEWLGRRSGRKINPPAMGNAQAGYPPLAAAPGAYVLME